MITCSPTKRIKKPLGREGTSSTQPTTFHTVTLGKQSTTSSQSKTTHHIEKQSHSVTGNPFQFGGAYKDDESCFMYMRFRYYDSRVRGFLSRDPIEDDSLGNLYAGFENNPSTFVDPMGLASRRDVMSILQGNKKAQEYIKKIKECKGKLPEGYEERVQAHVMLNGVRVYVEGFGVGNLVISKNTTNARAVEEILKLLEKTAEDACDKYTAPIVPVAAQTYYYVSVAELYGREGFHHFGVGLGNSFSYVFSFFGYFWDTDWEGNHSEVREATKREVKKSKEETHNYPSQKDIDENPKKHKKYKSCTS